MDKTQPIETFQNKIFNLQKLHFEIGTSNLDEINHYLTTLAFSDIELLGGVPESLKDELLFQTFRFARTEEDQGLLDSIHEYESLINDFNF